MTFSRGWRQRRAAAQARRDKHMSGSAAYREVSAEQHMRSLKLKFFGDAKTMYQKLVLEQDALAGQLERIRVVAAEERKIVSPLHPVAVRLSILPSEIQAARDALEPIEAAHSQWMAESDARLAAILARQRAESEREQRAIAAADAAIDAVMDEPISKE